LSSAEWFQRKGSQLIAAADRATDPRCRIELINIALSYFRLAELAQKNAQRNAASEAPRRRRDFDVA
jgi:hypothetical protein